MIGWRTGKLVVRFVTLVRDFTLCLVSVEADVVMCFGSVGVCMTPPPFSPMRHSTWTVIYSTWTVISSLRDLDR